LQKKAKQIQDALVISYPQPVPKDASKRKVVTESSPRKKTKEKAGSNPSTPSPPPTKQQIPVVAQVPVVQTPIPTQPPHSVPPVPIPPTALNKPFQQTPAVLALNNLNIQTVDLDEFIAKANVVLEENNQTIQQIRDNLYGDRIQDNTEHMLRFCKNITALTTCMNKMPVMVTMPALPIRLNTYFVPN